MLEGGEQQRLAFEIGNRLFVLRLVDVRFDHLLDRARRVAKVAILRQINGAHAAAANPFDNLVAMVQDLARDECLRLGSSLFAGAGARSRANGLTVFAGFILLFLPGAISGHGAGFS